MLYAFGSDSNNGDNASALNTNTHSDSVSFPHASGQHRTAEWTQLADHDSNIQPLSTP